MHTPAGWQERFLANGVTPYMKSELAVDDGVITVGRWRTLLGVVPLRWEVTTIPMNDVTGARVASAIHPERAFAAVVLALAALSFTLPTWLDIGLLVLTIAFVPLSFVAVLRVECADGRRLDAPICLLMIPRARRAATRLLERPLVSSG